MSRTALGFASALVQFSNHGGRGGMAREKLGMTKEKEYAVRLRMCFVDVL